MNTIQSPPQPTNRRRPIALVLLAALAVAAGVFLFSRRHADSVAPNKAELRRAELDLREGRYYHKDTTNLFTGVVVEAYPDARLLYRAQVSAGLLNGASEGWYTNGVLQIREHFTNGVSHGQREKWHANGNKMSEAFIVEGKLEGTFRRWSEAGQLAEQMQMKGGQPDGLCFSFYPSGFVQAQILMRAGQPVEEKRWAEGDAKELEAVPRQASR